MKNSILVFSVVGIFFVCSAVAASIVISNSRSETTSNVQILSPAEVSEPAMPDVSLPNALRPQQREAISGSLRQEEQKDTSKPDGPVLAPKVKRQEPSCNRGDIEEQYACYDAFYGEFVRTDGSSSAMEHIKTKYNSGDGFYRSQCHQLTHMVGRAATDTYATVSEAYTHGDSFCWSGYYHGVMEGIVSKIGGDVANKLDLICADLPGKAEYTFDYYNCVHGLGHGVMYILNDEVLESLKLCDNLTGSWEQSSCHGGVFMENIIADEVNHTSKYINQVDPHYPCNVVDEKYKGTCYLMQTSHMLKLAGGDFAKVFRQCEDAPNLHRNTCYQSLGRDASGRSISNVAQTKISCMLGQNDDALMYCFRGAVKDFISYHHSDVKARELCTTLSEKLQPDCLATVIDYYKRF